MHLICMVASQPNMAWIFGLCIQILAGQGTWVVRCYYFNRSEKIDPHSILHQQKYKIESINFASHKSKKTKTKEKEVCTTILRENFLKMIFIYWPFLRALLKLLHRKRYRYCTFFFFFNNLFPYNRHCIFYIFVSFKIMNFNSSIEN